MEPSHKGSPQLSFHRDPIPEALRHISGLCSESPPWPSLGSGHQEWPSGIRCEVTYVLSFSRQDCQLQEDRAWAAPRAGDPPRCSQPATTPPLPFSCMETKQPPHLPPNMVWLFLPLHLTVASAVSPALNNNNKAQGRAAFLRKHPTFPRACNFLLAAPLRPLRPCGLLWLLAKMAVQCSGKSIGCRANQGCAVTSWGWEVQRNDLTSLCFGSSSSQTSAQWKLWRPPTNAEG